MDFMDLQIALLALHLFVIFSSLQQSNGENKNVSRNFVLIVIMVCESFACYMLLSHL